MKISLHLTLVIALFTAISCSKEAKLEQDMADHFYLRNNGSDMPVYVHGNGASKVFILLLHGGPGDGGLKYRNHTFSNSIEEKYAMVYWDQRHQGNSQGHMKDSDFTIDQMVEDTHFLIKSLKLRYGNDISLFLMGHSWGGTLGTAYMLKDDYQNEVNGWIESAGAHDFPMINIELTKMLKTTANAEIAAGNHTAKWTEIRDYANTINIDNITTEQATQLNEYAGVAETLIKGLNTKTQSQLGDLEKFFFNPNDPLGVLLNGEQIPPSFYEELVSLSLTDQLNKITTPTLLQWGEYDFKVPKTIAEKAYEKINTTHKYLRIYNKSGHSSMRYEPELFVQDLVDFIEKYK